MSKFIVAADPNIQATTLAAATASGFAAWWAVATDIVLAVFGVPLQVMLASACGSFGARAMLPATTYGRALGGGLMWAMLGGWAAQLAQAIISYLISASLPVGALAGCAIIVAAIGQWLVEPASVQKLRAAAGRLLDGIGSKP